MRRVRVRYSQRSGRWITELLEDHTIWEFASKRTWSEALEMAAEFRLKHTRKDAGLLMPKEMAGPCVP